MLENIREREVLPKGPEDETIPTKIHELDLRADFIHDQMDALQRELQEMDVERVRLINRARELHICEDMQFKIVEEPIFPKKHVDIEALKCLAPDAYTKIVANLVSKAREKAREKFEEQMAKTSVSVAQADVKAVIASKSLLAQIIPEPKEPSGWRTVIVKKQ